MDHALYPIAQSAGGPVLGIDTSTATASLVLVDGATERVVSRSFSAQATPSESLVTGLAQALGDLQVSPQALKAIVVGLGPGSFTGLRVGLATAKGLALGGDVPLYGVSSSQVLAAAQAPGLVLAASDARRGGYYVALYEVNAQHIARPVLADSVMTLAALKLTLDAAQGEGGAGYASLRVVGDRAAEVAAALDAQPIASEPDMRYGVLAVGDRIRVHASDPTDALVPNYLRTSPVGI